MPTNILIFGAIGVVCFIIALILGAPVYLLVNLWWLIGLVALVGLYFGWRMHAVEDEFNF